MNQVIRNYERDLYPGCEFPVVSSAYKAQRHVRNKESSGVEAPQAGFKIPVADEQEAWPESETTMGQIYDVSFFFLFFYQTLKSRTSFESSFVPAPSSADVGVPSLRVHSGSPLFSK